MKTIAYIIILLCTLSACNSRMIMTVGSDGMIPTMKTGDKLSVDKNIQMLTYGDIIVYEFDGRKLIGSDFLKFESADDYVVKDDFYKDISKPSISRIVAIPGDTISIDNNICVINGRKNDYRLIEKIDSNRSLYEERFPNDVKIRIYRDSVNLPFITTHTKKVIIPEDCYYILSDNRSDGVDSRYINYISKDEVIGKIISIERIED